MFFYVNIIYYIFTYVLLFCQDLEALKTVVFIFGNEEENYEISNKMKMRNCCTKLYIRLYQRQGPNIKHRIKMKWNDHTGGFNQYWLIAFHLFDDRNNTLHLTNKI